MTTINSTKETSFENREPFDYKVVCETCQMSLILKTDDEKSRNWWHNCIDDLFYGMPRLEILRFSGENRKENHGHSNQV